MGRIQARCNNGHTFPSGFGIAPGVKGVSMQGCGAGPCPICGQMGIIVDGEYEDRNGIASLVRLLASPSMTAEKLRHVQDALKNAHSERADPKTVQAQLDQIENGLSAFVSWIEKNGGFDKWFDRALSIIMLLIAVKTMIDTPSVADIENLVSQRIEQMQRPAPARPLPIALGKSKPSKNTKCPCGSGMKYRKCHGQRLVEV